MKPTAWRLVLMAVLFAGWILYLGYLVYSRPLAGGRPLVLSRPQLLVSDLDVIARVDADDPTKPVRIEEILYPPGEKSLHSGDEILVANLARCRPLSREGDLSLTPEGQPWPPPDWTGPGDYLLPLHRFSEEGKVHYRVTLTPASPGYPGVRDRTPGPPRIYPATPQALAQYHAIRKP